MAELTGKAISELPESTTVNNAAFVALSDNGASKKMTLATLVGNLLKKTGDTMTGVYRFKGSNLDKDVAADSWSDSYPVVVDKDGDFLGNLRAFTLATGVSGVQLTGQNGSYQNFLRLGETANNEHYVAVTSPGTWRKALGLCYAVNDTFNSSYAYTLAGHITSSSTTIYFDVEVPKSLENISTVSITTLTGTLRGVSGYLDNNSADVNFKASPYTLSATKISNNRVRITITKSTAFTNVVNNSPVAGFMALSLKFT